MAGISSINQSSNNSNRQQKFEWSPQTKVLASCYSGPCGIPEVPSGPKFPASSPPQFRSSRKGPGFNGEAVHTITEECERLFCDTLWTVFLGERPLVPQQSLVIGAVPNGKNASVSETRTTPGRIQNFIEVWDYAGDTIYRGFVAADGDRRTLFVFFDSHTVAGQGFKSGLMALFEIASIPEIDCTEMVACIDRSMDPAVRDAAIRNLGWVGFELSSLNDWVVPPANEAIISKKWLLMTVET